MLKLNLDGSVAWQKTYGGADWDYARAIRQTADGGYVVVGGADAFGAGFNAWVLKLSADGDVAWQKIYGGSSDDWAQAIQQTADGGYVVAGDADFWHGQTYAWVLKLEADGSVVWHKVYSRMWDDSAHAMQQTADGGYVVAGSTASFEAGNYEAWVLKLDADGSEAWQKDYGGTSHDHAYAIQQTADGGYVVAGSTTSFGAGGADAWVLKLDADGGFCEGCPLEKDADLLPTDGSTSAVDSDAVPVDSSATVTDSSATVTDTNAIPEPICACPPFIGNRAE